MKIIIIGNNNSPLKTKTIQPYFYLKPDSALLKDNKPFFIPDFTKDMIAEFHPVIRISRLGKNIAERFAYRYYDAITIGVNLIANDLNQNCIAEKLPWEISTSFDGSAIIGEFIPADYFKSLQSIHLKIKLDEEFLQEINTNQLYLSPEKIIAWISKFYTIKTGDLIYMGNINNNSIIHIGEKIQGFLEQKEVFNFHIR